MKVFGTLIILSVLSVGCGSVEMEVTLDRDPVNTDIKCEVEADVWKFEDTENNDYLEVELANGEADVVVPASYEKLSQVQTAFLRAVDTSTVDEFSKETSCVTE